MKSGGFCRNAKFSLVQGSTYDLSQGEGKRILDQCLARAASFQSAELVGDPEPAYGSPQLVAPRLGQGTFRVAVLDAYGRACAVTGEHSLPALEAAHIKPFALHGPSRVSNGLTLRADIHRLFDKGYVTVTPDARFIVSDRLKDDFDNGRTYFPFHGAGINLPKAVEDKPRNELLRWHNEEVFR